MKIKLPLEVYTTKSNTPKSKFILNLNNYRNCHFIKLNKAKKEYAKTITPLLKGKIKGTVELEYTYYAKTKRRIDISNPCSVIDKFTCDALTEAGIWEDDNCDIIKSVKYVFGGIDKENPRCEMTIKSLE